MAGVDVSFVAAGLGAAAAQQQVPVNAGRRDTATARAASNAGLLDGAQLLWLDARPAHNRAERRVFRALGMSVTAVTTVDAATAEQLAARIGQLVPVIVYSRRTAGKPTPSHCFAQTERPDDLLHSVIDALERTRR